MLARAAGLLGLWLVLTDGAPGDLPAGVLVAAAAAAASVRLLPPGRSRVRPGGLARLALHVLREAGPAGADVAWRALSPRMPLRTGVVSHPLRLAPGPARDAFAALSSLLPGTVAAGVDARGALRVHCLDTDAPIAARLAGDEARVARALGEPTDG